MTDNQPPEPELLLQKHRSEAAFFARDPHGNKYRYVHLGNVERKRLAELLDLLPAVPAERDFWQNLQSKLAEDLDDL